MGRRCLCWSFGEVIDFCMVSLKWLRVVYFVNNLELYGNLFRIVLFIYKFGCFGDFLIIE